MNTIYKKISFLLMLCSVSVTAQQTPASKQSESILITGVTAHIGNGTIIKNAAIGFDNGKITFIGAQNKTNSANFSKIIDVAGKHVYPGFIAANTSSGLVEIDAVRATNDLSETGAVNPHIRSIVAYNAESKVTESLRPNGVLIGQITPRGGTFSGTSSIVQFDAWNWEDAILKVDDGIHVNWPSGYTYESRKLVPSKTYNKNIENIKSFTNNAKAYLTGNKTVKNAPFEAISGLFNGNQRFFVHVSGQKEIIDVVHFCKETGIQNLVIVHGTEAYKVADLLVKNNIPVLIDRAHRLPSSSDEDVHLPYKLAKLLIEKGVTVGISIEGGMERMQSRNLPFYAGTFAAYGIEKEEALKLITSNTAKILGIDNIVGTLEVGKDATLFISEGDALDMRTNILSHAFIQGRKLSLETHQTKLWKRYSEKYNH